MLLSFLTGGICTKKKKKLPGASGHLLFLVCQSLNDFIWFPGQKNFLTIAMVVDRVESNSVNNHTWG